MKKIILSTVCLLLTFQVFPQSWTLKTTFPYGTRIGTTTFGVGDKLYVGNGWNGGTLYKNMWEYNTSTLTWQSKADFPGLAGRAAPVVFVIGTKAYFGLGHSNGVLQKDFWEYNTVNNVWTRKADFPLTRKGACSFVLNSKGYVFAGEGPTAEGDPYMAKRDLWEYNPATDLWTQKASLPSTPSDPDGGLVRRTHSFGFAVNGKGYIGGGRPVSYSTPWFADLWEYDPNSNQWITKAPLPPPYQGYQGLGHALTASTCDGVYIFGGQTSNGTWESSSINHPSTWFYNPVANTFTSVSQFPPNDYNYTNIGAAYLNGAAYGGFPKIMEYKQYTVNGPDYVCGSATFTLHNFYNHSFTWQYSTNLSLSSSTTNPPVINVNKITNGPGYIRGVYTVANGCQFTVTKNVQVGPATANFSISAYPYCASPGEVVDFTAEIQNVNYNWVVNGGSLLGGQGTRFMYARMDYPSMAVHCSVTGTSAANCYGPQGTSSVYINECYGFSSVTTSPNPASTSFDVELSEKMEESEPVEVEIRNDYGALIKSETVQGGNFKINVANLRKGLYILKVRYRDQVLTHRVIIEN